MEQDGVNIIRMTGAELRRIQEASGLTQEEFAETKLKISRTQLGREFAKEEIPEAIEARIDTDTELGHLKNTLLGKVAVNQQVEPVSDLNKYFIETMSMMREIMGEMRNKDKIIDKAVLGLTDDNKYYREENSKLLNALLSK